jgi:hypothetical protein
MTKRVLKIDELFWSLLVEMKEKHYLQELTINLNLKPQNVTENKPENKHVRCLKLDFLILLHGQPKVPKFDYLFSEFFSVCFCVCGFEQKCPVVLVDLGHILYLIAYFGLFFMIHKDFTNLL